jgi:hypothetical protein
MPKLIALNGGKILRSRMSKKWIIKYDLRRQFNQHTPPECFVRRLAGRGTKDVYAVQNNIFASTISEQEKRGFIEREWDGAKGPKTLWRARLTAKGVRQKLLDARLAEVARQKLLDCQPPASVNGQASGLKEEPEVEPAAVPPAEAPKPKPEPDAIHSFQVAVAVTYGLTAAVVCQFAIRFFFGEGPVVRSKEITRPMVLRACPYLGDWDARSALETLAKGIPKKQKPIFHRKKNKHGVYVYTLDPNYDEFEFDAGLKETGVHRFERDFAVRQAANGGSHSATRGILAAVMMNNFKYWIEENWRRALENITDRKGFVGTGLVKGMLESLTDDLLSIAKHTESASEWKERHRYASLATVKRTMAALIESGELVVTHGVRRACCWSLPEQSLRKFCVQFLAKYVRQDADQCLWRVR